LKAIIYGANGQDGYYLSRLLEKEKIEFLSISRSGTGLIGDVGDYELVKKQINKFQPDYIFHLAANSTTRHEALFENHQAISTGSINILEAVRLHCPNSKVFLSGSAMQFSNMGLPIDEQTPFDPSSPYSVSRIHSVYAARYYRKKYGLSVFVGYLFNHDSPLRTEQHINQKIVKTVIRIAAGSNEKLELGDIEVMKEFNFASDIVEAIWVLVNQNYIFEVVIGCGVAHSIKEWADYCFNKINKKWHDYVIYKEGYISEYRLLVSNPKLILGLGWKAKVDFYSLADIMIEAAKLKNVVHINNTNL